MKGILANPTTGTQEFWRIPLRVPGNSGESHYGYSGILANPTTGTREFWRIPLRVPGNSGESHYMCLGIRTTFPGLLLLTLLNRFDDDTIVRFAQSHRFGLLQQFAMRFG